MDDKGEGLLLSQIFTWPCKGKCGVEFNEENDKPWKKFCSQCYKQRHKYKRTKFTTVEKSVLYCIKGQPCNTNMLMAYCGTTYRSAISKAVNALRKKYIITTVRSERNEFYHYGGLK